LGDIQAFMEACSNITEKELDLVITSPGGSPEAAESIISYLRTRFSHIRVIVPVAAMSAATMIALAADEIVMGSHSQLGPIDPQFTVSTPEGPRSAPGQAILDQFEQAKRECQNPQNIAAWLPMLRSLLPGLLAQCRNQRELAEQFARESLERYMFQGDPKAAEKAEAAARYFADFKAFKSHGRRVSRDDARAVGINVVDLESSPDLQDAVLSVHHAIRHTFTGTATVKLVENHHGRAYIESVSVQVVQNGPAGGGPVAPNPLASPGLQPQQPPGPNREQRRRQVKGR
jgi:hypothetical protein